MEDDNGLELSLGLSFGGSNGKVKGKDATSSDVKTEEGGTVDNSMGDLRNFLNTSIQKKDVEDGSQTSDASQSKENFFTNLVNSGSADLQVGSAQQFASYWGGNSAEVEEVKSDPKDSGSKPWLEAANKRKMSFEEFSHQKRPEREVQHTDAHGRAPPMVNSSVRASHISVATEDGSTEEHEDVAESEVGGSTSGLVSHFEDVTKQYSSGGCGSSEVVKERYGQKQSNPPPGNDPRLGNSTYGTPLQPMSRQYALSSKVSSVNGESSASGFPSPSAMQLMPPASNEGPGSLTVNPGNLPLTFGYSPVQIPTLNNESSWGLMSHHMQLPSSYAGRSISSAIPNLGRLEDVSNMSRVVTQASSEASPDTRKTSELKRSFGKQHATEEGGASSSSPTEEETKGSRTKEAYHNQAVEGPLSSSVIRPGIALGLKFGGSGSYPDLPWVSTTGSGPNGRTISGVTYRYEKNQIRIVCACHGFHMSPEEFVQHASADHQNPENNTSFPNGNPAASAQS
ncbi:hypothetical protein IFM89_003788 [Coptis chinensis]|uniref:Ninja-family protein n=1 Tax=Coptis chinensis TaxID=261450 RepID=A0A835IBE9_9MAGN|nr:hypothetical protein IFM89_003788 [Coptis chinensis]